MSGNESKNDGCRVLEVSVGELLDLVARRGDLFYEGIQGPTALAGIRAHQKIQASRSAPWEKETSLTCRGVIEGVSVQLSGRADLINTECSPIQVEEIKSTLVPAMVLPESRREYHRDQAAVYAWMLAQRLWGDSDNALTDLQESVAQREVLVKVTWIDLSTEQLHSEDQTLRFTDLHARVLSLIEHYVRWRQQLSAAQRAMRESVVSLPFPFDQWRPDQQQTSRMVYVHIRDQKSLLLESPTGSGKTVTVLYPAVHALGAQLVQSVLYLTARNSAQITAVEALQRMQSRGWKGRALQLQARSSVCPCRSEGTAGDCLDEHGQCLRTRNFYDRLPAARSAALESPMLDRAGIARLADEHQLCPFALMMELVPWVDVVIADLNYLFDPLVQLDMLSARLPQTLLLVDETHNLPGRARGMYSQTLTRADLKILESCLQPDSQGGEAAHLKARLLKRGRSLRRALWGGAVIEGEDDNRPDKRSLQLIDQFLLDWTLWQQKCADEAPQDLFAGSPPSHTESASEVIRKLVRYRRLAELFDGCFRFRRLQHDTAGMRGGEAAIVCLDARQFLQQKLQSCSAVVAFSATLQPMSFYSDMLALEDASWVQLPSHFPCENQLTLVASYIDTRWQNRAASAVPLARLIELLVGARQGKYLVFFPSYQYLSLVREELQNGELGVDTLYQSADDDASQRQAFLQAFLDQKGALLGLAVIGGIYSEAVDFVGDALHGVVVISPALAQPGEEHNWLQDYYRGRGLDGFRYASQYPGFTKVQQAVGRLIRHERDRGVAILVDPRFAQPAYRRLYPAHWQPRIVSDEQTVSRQLRQFWGQKL